jgi:hypothetical protein
MFCTPHLIFSGDQIENNEMNGSCSVYGGEERFIEVFDEDT